MRMPLNHFFCATLLLLAFGNVMGRATESQTVRGSEMLAPGRAITCSMHEPLREPLDPPVTSALPHHEKFAAADHFNENIAPGAEVRISWLGATFMRRFAVKIEEDAGQATLQTYDLTRPSRDDQIVAELGDRYEAKLADVWCLLRRQPNGEDGILKTNAAPNVFFVRDATGALGAVDAVWGGAGWEIGASGVEGQRQWPSGSRVISR